ncbi:MAG: hypothetical protein ACRD16_09455 [Thermoanaerobaculia bacterium]
MARTTDHGRQAGLLFAALLAVLLALPFAGYSPIEFRFGLRAPQVIRGDEPHYLLVVNSLLFDRDLDLRADYSRALLGGFDAGRILRGVGIDHATFLVDARTGSHAGWWTVFDAGRPLGHGLFRRLSPRFPDSSAYLERSDHPAGYPLLVAALLRPFPLDRQGVEIAMALLNALAAWTGLILVYELSLGAGLSRRYAVLAVALLVASPWLFYSQGHYSEIFQGVALLASLLALQRNRPGLAGFLAGLAVWIKPALGLVLAAWIFLTWRQKSGRDALRTAGAGAFPIAGFLAFNWWQAHTLLVSGNGDPTWRPGLSGLLATLLDREHGLLTFAPWALLAFAAFVSIRPKRGALLSDIALPVLLMLVLLASFGPLGADCYGPRYWVPMLPWLAIAAAIFVARGGLFVRGLTVLLFVAGLAISVPAALEGGFAWNAPPLRPAAFLLEGLPGKAGASARAWIQKGAR